MLERWRAAGLLGPALLTLVTLPVLLVLGTWQLQRLGWKQDLIAKLEARVAAEPVSYTSVLAEFHKSSPDLNTGDVEYMRVRVTGTFDHAEERHVYAPRSSSQGWNVFTLLKPEGGQPPVYVNRGWVPFSGYRDRLPDVSLTDTEQPVTVTGRVDTLPVEGMASGHSAPPAGAAWPKVTSFPHTGEIGAALGHPVEERQVLLDPSMPDGYVRSWLPPGVPPERHYSYAAQWWLFAATVGVLYGLLNLHKVNR